MFIIKFECKEAKGTGGYLLTREGSSAWVVNEPEGWVEATARSAQHSDELQTDLKVFNTQEEARNFIERWEGHPWYYVPNGKYEILEVREVFEKVVTGYTRVSQETQVRCQLCDGTGSLCEDDTLYYRWVVINNQETCYCRIVKVLDGYFKSAEDVKEQYKDDYCFEECLFGVKPIDFSATPKWLAKKTGEFVK